MGRACSCEVFALINELGAAHRFPTDDSTPGLVMWADSFQVASVAEMCRKRSAIVPADPFTKWLAKERPKHSCLWKGQYTCATTAQQCPAEELLSGTANRA